MSASCRALAILLQVLLTFPDARGVTVPGEENPPFELHAPSPAEIRDFQTAWEGALLAFRAGRFAEAAQKLRVTQPAERSAQVYRAAFFAEASLAAGSK